VRRHGIARIRPRFLARVLLIFSSFVISQASIFKYVFTPSAHHDASSEFSVTGDPICHSAVCYSIPAGRSKFCLAFRGGLFNLSNLSVPSDRSKFCLAFRDGLFNLSNPSIPLDGNPYRTIL